MLHTWGEIIVHIEFTAVHNNRFMEHIQVVKICTRYAQRYADCSDLLPPHMPSAYYSLQHLLSMLRAGEQLLNRIQLSNSLLTEGSANCAVFVVQS